MSNIAFRASAYLQYLTKRKSIQYIHSPFLFSLMQEVFVDSPDTTPIIFKGIEMFRTGLIGIKEEISYEDYGAGGDKQRIKKVTIGSMAKKSLKQARYARFLFRLTRFVEAKNVVELGTSFGITTLYLSEAVGRFGAVHTVEADKNILAVAQDHWPQTLEAAHPVYEYCFDLNEEWSSLCEHIGRIDFLFIDANHRKEAMIRYVLQAMPYMHQKSVVVVDDIYWNKDTLEGWEILKNRKEVTLSFDIFQMGVLFFDKNLSKEDFTLKY